MAEHAETLLEWEAPERVFVKRSKKYFKNLFAILFILAAVAIFFRQFILAAVFGGFGFLQYALGTVPPRGTKHKITRRGIYAFDRAYDWDELTGFWFEKVSGEEVLNIETTHTFPRRLTLLLAGQDKEKIASLLERHIPLKEPPREDQLGRAFRKASQKIRLE